MKEPSFSSSGEILLMLTGIVAVFFFIQQITRWKLFEFAPPFLWIFMTPLILSMAGVLPTESPVYVTFDEVLLPLVLTLLLINIDLRATVHVLRKGIYIVLLGIAGIVLGAPVAFAIVRTHLDPEAWKTFGVLAGSLIGGSGNMAAVAGALNVSGSQFGLAVLANNLIYLLWLPLLIVSKKWAGAIDKIHRITPRDTDQFHSQAPSETQIPSVARVQDIVYLLAIGFIVTWISSLVALLIPEQAPVMTSGTYRILLITIFSLAISFTPARKIPGGYELATALIYVFVSSMGARAEISSLGSDALWFILGAMIWVFFHANFVMAGARLLKVDFHTAAVASAAIIGGVATGPIVALHHRPSLVSASILMALIGYAIGNFGAIIAAYLCNIIGS